MKPSKLFLTLFGIVLFILLSCKKEHLETDPAKAILGKWVFIEMRGMGTIKIKPNGSYTEYFKNGIVKHYDAIDGKINSFPYFFDDSTLNVRIIYDASDGTEIWQKSLFKFSDRNNILTTDMSPWADAMFDVFVEKRIE